MAGSYHIPVMLHETVEMLVHDAGGTYADGTLGGGGHAAAILEIVRGKGRLYAFDADPGAIANARERFGEEWGDGIVVRQAYFTQAVEMLAEERVALDGVLLDLGVSSRQLDSDQIGLSYRQEMPLDMRFDMNSERSSAADIVNNESAEDLATLLRRYGEEPAAWTIARAIVRRRSAKAIDTTADLRGAVESVIPGRFLIKTLSRVFQALRIAANDELGELERALDGFIPLLRRGGRFAVLTYHSLEDRIVKEKFREEERDCICPPEFPVCRCSKERRLKIMTRKPLVPTADEVERNPRARSAKLRVAERVIDERPGHAGSRSVDN
ncbi:MAG TPA: 16S rRNA (cytosine(1402)-N(4))-methyltransferase RsmH [Candidatus Kapabacteria bacterium]|nr:16S rRNA (cytosine(1402)-N(4))-methyltransferase RsmH [Candidatus Kapabacteria bacterium]